MKGGSQGRETAQSRSAWGKYLGDATVTAAILDRLAMTAGRLDIDGPSYRQHLARLRANEPDAPDLDAT